MRLGGGTFDGAAALSFSIATPATFIRESDARIAALTGMSFGPAYLDGLLADRDTLFCSRPTIAAVLAAGSIRPDSELAMLHAI